MRATGMGLGSGGGMRAAGMGLGSGSGMRTAGMGLGSGGGMRAAGMGFGWPFGGLRDCRCGCRIGRGNSRLDIGTAAGLAAAGNEEKNCNENQSKSKSVFHRDPP